MAALIIRTAGEADLPTIIGLLAADSFGRLRETPGEPLDACYRAAFAAIEADPNQALVVGERDGRVIACLQLSFIPGLSRRGAWRGLVEGVRVAEDARNGGVGEAMMRWVIAHCRARGCALVQLTTDRRREDAQRFYLRLGFQPSHVGMKLALT